MSKQGKKRACDHFSERQVSKLAYKLASEKQTSEHETKQVKNKSRKKNPKK